jgi:hypothetical protein
LDSTAVVAALLQHLEDMTTRTVVQVHNLRDRGFHLHAGLYLVPTRIAISASSASRSRSLPRVLFLA